MIKIEAATLAHAEAMAPHLRDADAAEVIALGVTPLYALVESVRGSLVSWVALEDGEPICIWGVSAVDALGQAGCPWLLTTPAVERHKRLFMVTSRVFMLSIAAMFPRLENYVDPRHKKAVRWLAWLGFRLDPPAPLGPLGLPFQRITMGA